MPRRETVALPGAIGQFIAHRFTLAADGRADLADLTPKGLEALP